MTNIAESKFYALLIGINYYESIQTYPQLYKNLGGCVRDIDLVADYLKTTLQIPQEQIWKLTAPVEESKKLAEIRAANGNILPTYENIVKAFEEITALTFHGIFCSRATFENQFSIFSEFFPFHQLNP